MGCTGRTPARGLRGGSGARLVGKSCVPTSDCFQATQADHWATEAVEIGTRHSTPVPIAMGRLAKARVRILHGEVHEGMALLDEAAAALLSSDLTRLAGADLSVLDPHGRFARKGDAGPEVPAVT